MVVKREKSKRNTKKEGNRERQGEKEPNKKERKKTVKKEKACKEKQEGKVFSSLIYFLSLEENFCFIYYLFSTSVLKFV